MRKLFLAAVCVVLVSCVAVAQDFPNVEVFGGYSLMKLGGEDMNDTFDYWEEGNEEEGISVSTSKWLKKGFMASAAFNMNEYFGIEANVQYNTGDILDLSIEQNWEGTIEIDGKAKMSDFSIMAGPKFALRKHEAITPFFHFLIGMNRVAFDPSFSCSWEGEECPAYILEEIQEEAHMTEASDKGFGYMIGGGIDVNLGDAVAIRLIELDYLKAYHEMGGSEGEDEFQMGNMNLAFGIVFKLGQ